MRYSQLLSLSVVLSLFACSAGDRVPEYVTPDSGSTGGVTVSVLSPIDGSTVGGTVALIAQVQGASSASVEFLIDGEHYATVMAAPYQASWDTSTASAGTHTVTAKATAGASTVQASVQVHVGMGNNQGPSIVLTTPASDFVAGAAVPLQAQVTDDAAISNVSFSFNGTTFASDSRAPFTATWSTSGLPDGAYVIKVTATDSMSRTATISRQLTLDQTPPTVSVSSPANGATLPTGSVTLTANASDVNGIQRVDFAVDSSTVGSATSAPYSVSLSSIAAGHHTLVATAYDMAGNFTATAPVSFTVGSQFSVSFASPQNGATLSGNVNLAANVVSSNSVTGVQFYANGSPIAAGVVDSSSQQWKATWSSCSAMNGAGTLVAQATDNQGHTAQASVNVTFSNVVGGTPQLSGSVQGDTVSLSWQVCSTVNTYRVYWAHSPGVSTADQSKDVTGQSFTDSTQPAGMVYYRVAVVQSGRAGTLSNEVALKVAAVSSCSTKYDCASGEICEGSQCQTWVNGSSCMQDSQCPKGMICDYNASDTCLVGCADSRDCLATQTCSVQSYTCGSSTSSCTDASCQQLLGQWGYCDTSKNSCQRYECLADSDCASPNTCDLSTHTCKKPPCDTTKCNAMCGGRCDTSTCFCLGAGADGDMCGADADCQQNLFCTASGVCRGAAVTASGAACDVLSCFLAGGCVDAANRSYVCSSTTCLFLSQTGGPTACQ